MASGVAGWPQDMPRQIWNMPGGLTKPFSMKRLASNRWPVSNTSSSGVTPAAVIAAAIACRCFGVLTKTRSPMLRLPMSRLQMSGLSSTTWRTRSSGDRSTLSGPGFVGSALVVRKPRARAGGEVDEHVGAARPDALDHLAIERVVHARLGGLRIAHVDVHDGRAGLGGIDRGAGDLFRRHRHRRVAAGRVGRAGHRA